MTTLPGHSPEASTSAIVSSATAALLFVGVEDRRSVAGADIVALTVLGRRIVDLEEELEQVAEGLVLRVEDDLDRLGMRAVVAVGRVGDIAAGVADSCRDHPGPLADQILHAPEATSREDGPFSGSTHDRLLLIWIDVGEFVTQSGGFEP